MSDYSTIDMAKLEARFETQPFCADELTKQGIEVPKCKAWIEINQRSRLFSLLNLHAVKVSGDAARSFQPFVTNDKVELGDELLGRESTKRVALTAGLGIFRFEHKHEGETFTIWNVRQRRGPVVGTNCFAATWENLVVLCECADVPLGRGVLQGLCSTLIAADEQTKDTEFSLFRWNVEQKYWDHSGTKKARAMESVVLPPATKDRLMQDLDSFLTRETYDFYVHHGIPFKRSYLFWGEPGAGKTSLIQAIAGKYKRNLCIMQPTDPRFTDDALASAIKEAPRRSIIVLEDVDALFAKDRTANARLSITFSGLLNALDGIANPDGQIFILTTNFRENLDSALIRNGRVDLHVEFRHASADQMEMIFLQFYPEAAIADAVRFREGVAGVLEGRKVNMAALQHFFIGQRGRTAEEAIASVGKILEDLKEKAERATESEKEQQKKKAGEERKKKSQKEKGKNVKGGKQGRKGSHGGVHVYINSTQRTSSSSDSTNSDSSESDDAC